MRPRRLYSVAQPFEVYRTLDMYSFNQVQSFRDNVLDEMAFLNGRAGLPTFFERSYEISDTKLQRVEIGSNKNIVATNYEKYLKGTPHSLGKALLNSLSSEIDFKNIEAEPSSFFCSQLNDKLYFGLTLEKNDVLADAAFRVQKTLRSWVHAEILDSTPHLFIGSVSVPGSTDEAKKSLTTAGASKLEQTGKISLFLGPVMFAGQMFDADEAENQGPYQG